MRSADIISFPTHPRTPWPTAADTDAIVSPATSLSRQWGVTVEGNQRATTVYVGRQSGGASARDAIDAYSLTPALEPGLVELVNLPPRTTPWARSFASKMR